MKLRLITVAVATAALLAGATRASAHTASIDIGGRFVCTIGGDEVPLDGAHPRLFIERFSLSETWFARTDPGNTAYTDSSGAFRFLGIEPGDTYWVDAALNDADGVSVRAWGSALPFQAQTRQYNIEGAGPAELGTSMFPGPTCGVFEAVRQAEANYKSIMGSRPPYGDLHVDYGGPTEGFPWADATTIEWPSGYADGDAAALNVAASHAFALTIENFALQGSPLLASALRWDIRVRRDPCATTTPEVAFYEGFASFWARDYAPAPDCGSVTQSDASVEGMVAWRLTRMEQLCPTATRKQMVATLLKSGPALHSIDDFAAALGPCNAGFLDVSRVQRYRWAAQVDAGRFVKDVQAEAREARLQADRIATKLDTARQAAAQAVCPPFPCGKALAAKVAPSILSGAVKQENLVAKNLSAQVSQSAQKQLTGPLSQEFLHSVLATPPTLTQQLGAIAAKSFDAGLAAAAPLVRSGRSSKAFMFGWSAITTQDRMYRRLGKGQFRFGSVGPETGAGGVLPVSGVTANRPDDRMRPIAWSGQIHFWSGSGVPVDGIQGIRWGGPRQLGFPADPGPRTCDGSPIEIADATFNGAQANDCPAADRPGERATGTMLKFPAPVRSVSIGVGAKRNDPFGHYFPIATELIAYDSHGRQVALETTTVLGNPAGKPEQTLKLSVGKDVGIVYLKLDLNTYFSDSGETDLTFTELGWVGA